MGGRVLDIDGNPLIGANVQLLKTKKGAITGIDGRYNLTEVKSGKYTVRVSYLGYRTVTRDIDIPEAVQRYLLNIQMVEEVLELDELIVKSTRAGALTPMTYTNIDKETLEEANIGQDVPYLIRWTPSTVVTSDAGTGIGYTGIRIRGTDPTRINVTINGIPLNDAESQGTFWVNLPDFASSTNDIQIQRGVGTSTNGAGAFGATINLNTNKLQEKAYGRINTSLGSFATRKANASFGTGLIDEKFSFDGRISRINSEGFIDRGSADLESFYLSGTYLGKKSSLRLNVFSGHEVTYQAWNGVPAQYLDNPDLRTFNTAGMEKSGDPYDREVDDYTQTHYQAFYNRQFSRNLHFNLALHYTKGAGYFEQYKAGEQLTDYGFSAISIGDTTITETDLIRRRWLDNDFYGTTFSLDYTSTDRKIGLTLGGAWNQYEGAHFGEVIWARYASESEIRDRYYDNDATKRDFNFFGKLNYQLTSLLNAYVDLQYRNVDYTFIGFDNDGANIQQDDQLHFFNPKFGLFYSIDTRSEAYASFAVANREPNRTDYTESTPTSRPNHESLYNLETGYRRTLQKAAFGVNAYYMYYRNQLALTGQINDVGEYTRRNIPESYRLGVELIGGVELVEGLNLNATATVSRNKIETFTEFVDNWDTGEQDIIVHNNTDIAFSPNVITSGELSYEFLRDNPDASICLSWLNKYVSKQYIDNTSNENTVLDPYFFSDLRLQIDLNNKWIRNIGLTLMVQNLFDNQFSTNAWTYRYISAGYDGRPDDPYTRLEGGNTYNLTGFFPQAGRNYLIGLNLEF
jgi:iron complex outermembrane receptor protein